MARRRTTVFADEKDLAILKDAAARLGVAEAELLRDAIHLAAMANRTWDEPFFSHIYGSEEGGGEGPGNGGRGQHAGEVLRDVMVEKTEAYERTKSPGR